MTRVTSGVLPGKQQATRHTAAGQRLIKSVKQAITSRQKQNEENLALRVATNPMPLVDVMSLRQGLGLSQSEFAERFRLNPSSIKNWEQGRTQPDGPARTLLAVIAHNPSAVDAALRRAS